MRLITEDRAAQAPISIFIDAFLVSVVGIVALYSRFYSRSERLILFVVTILVQVVLIGAADPVEVPDQVQHLRREVVSGAGPRVAPRRGGG